jgi:hypothetical protein
MLQPHAWHMYLKSQLKYYFQVHCMASTSPRYGTCPACLGCPSLRRPAQPRLPRSAPPWLPLAGTPCRPRRYAVPRTALTYPRYLPSCDCPLLRRPAQPRLPLAASPYSASICATLATPRCDALPASPCWHHLDDEALLMSPRWPRPRLAALPQALAVSFRRGLVGVA